MDFIDLDNKKINKSNYFTKQCIITALFNILKTKDLERITISEVVSKAGVSRMGFYRNYTSKEDVIEKYILAIFLDTLEEVKKSRTLHFDIKHIIKTTLTHFQKHSEYIKLLLARKQEMLLHACYEKAFYFLYNQKKNSRIREYSTRMFIGEIFNLEIAWIKNGMVETPEQMAKIYYRVLKLRLNS